MSSQPSTVNSQPAAVIAPSWDRARQILQGIKLHIRLSVAGQCILGFELANLKKELGYSRGNNKGGPNGQFVRSERTWEDLVKDELDVSSKTADRFIEMFEGAKARHKKLGGAEKLIGIFETPASELTAIDRQTLEAAVSKLTDGITQKELLEELKLVKIYDTSGIGGDTSKHPKKDKPNLGQLAFAFFQPLAKDLQNICTHPDRDKFFTVLAKEEPSKLNEMEVSLESALHAIRAAKATHTTGTVIR